MGNTSEPTTKQLAARLIELELQLYRLGINKTIIDDEMINLKLVSPETIKFLGDITSQVDVTKKYGKDIKEIYGKYTLIFKLRYDALYNCNPAPYLDYMKTKID